MATTDTPAATPRTQPATRKQSAAPKRKPRASAKPIARAAVRRARTGSTTSTQPKTRAAQAQQLAERALLIPVGAALEAGDRVAELVATTRSRRALEQRLDRFERRGGSARTQLEREVRKTRTRLDREARNARRRLDRRREQARKTLGANVESVGNVVQNGVGAGIKLVNEAQERLAKVA